MRKLDRQGRVVIPTILRERLGIKENSPMYFSTARMNGKNYVLITDGVQHQITKADADITIRTLERIGAEVPDKLYQMRETL